MTTFFEDTKMIQHEIYDEMKKSYIDYAMSVIVSRALPMLVTVLSPFTEEFSMVWMLWESLPTSLIRRVHVSSVK